MGNMKSPFLFFGETVVLDGENGQDDHHHQNQTDNNRIVIHRYIKIAPERKKNQTEDEKKMVEMISSSYDISDKKFIAPIVEYFESEN